MGETRIRATSEGAHILSLMHVITSLDVGGAQMVLLRLLSSVDQSRLTSSVLSLLPLRDFAASARDLNVPVASIEMGRSIPGPAHLQRLWRCSVAATPHVIQGWMYHGNLASTFIWWRQRRRPKLVWNVRHSLDRLSQEPPLTRHVIRLLSALSRGPDAIVYCSKAGLRQHQDIGFEASRSVLIPNGFDTAVFRPDPLAAARLRALIGVPSRPLLGVVARVDPMKDHPNLLRAAALLRDEGVDGHLVLIGRGADPANINLNHLIREHGLTGLVSLLGQRDDVADLISGLDLLVSPSAWGEAFPNAVGEAMASGVPCVVTDVGDSGWLVDSTGETVPPRDPHALAAGLKRMLSLSVEARRNLGAQARLRIVSSFALASTVRQYESLYFDLAAA